MEKFYLEHLMNYSLGSKKKCETFLGKNTSFSLKVFRRMTPPTFYFCYISAYYRN